MTKPDIQSTCETAKAIHAILGPLDDRPCGSWGYVLAKVLRYLDAGAVAYRNSDAFGQPPAAWSSDVLAAVQAGMQQLLAGKGIVRAAPLEGLDVPAVHALLHVLHFGLDRVKTTQRPDHSFLDEMRFRHAVVSGQFVVVYALFAPDIDELDAEVDVPTSTYSADRRS